MKACFAKRLSPKCAAQANAPPSTPRDAACQEEFKAVSGSCGGEMMAGSDRCMASKLEPKCQAQFTGAKRKAEEMQARCLAEAGPRMARVQACLKLPQAEQDRCVEKVKAEKSSCDF